jgi:hypothetical protein
VEPTSLYFGHGTIESQGFGLSAADKDGGAHVDAKLNADYESLMNSNGFGFFLFVSNGRTRNIHANY